MPAFSCLMSVVVSLFSINYMLGRIEFFIWIFFVVVAFFVMKIFLLLFSRIKSKIVGFLLLLLLKEKTICVFFFFFK